jgi:hypothetical protein
VPQPFLRLGIIRIVIERISCRRRIKRRLRCSITTVCRIATSPRRLRSQLTAQEFYRIADRNSQEQSAM